MRMTNYIPSHPQRMFIHRHRALATSIDIVPPQIAKRELAGRTCRWTAAQFVLAFLATKSTHGHIDNGPGMRIEFSDDDLRQQDFILGSGENLFTGKYVVPICLPDVLNSVMAAGTIAIVEAEDGVAE